MQQQEKSNNGGDCPKLLMLFAVKYEGDLHDSGGKMRTVVLILFFSILCALLHFAFAEDAAPDAAKPADDLQAKISALIEQLGSPDFETRENATAELVKIGLPAIELVDKARSSTDAEVAFRAERILNATLHGLTMEQFKNVQELSQKIRGTSAETLSAEEFLNLQNVFQEYMPAAEPFIEELLDDPNPVAQYAACWVLARTRNEKALQKIDYFLKEYGPLADDRQVDNKDRYKVRIAYGVMELLNHYGREQTTPIAEKYLRQPYIKMGILRYGMWNESHYDAFAALAQEGMLDDGEVMQYFLRIKDKRIIPFLKERLRQGKQVNGALTVLGGIAPGDPETKDLLLQYAQVDYYCHIALQVLSTIDAETASRLIREKLTAFFAAAKGEPCPFNANELLGIIRNIEGNKALDILESAALVPQLQQTAVRMIFLLPDIDKSRVSERILAKYQGDPVPLLEIIAEYANRDLLHYFTAPDSSRASTKPGYEKTLRMIVGFDHEDPAGYMLKKIPEITDTDVQLRMLALIASSRRSDLLADVEKAFDGFEARHRRHLEEKFKRPGGDNPEVNEYVEANLADDMFRFAFYLNMLGKKNEADLRSFLLDHDFFVRSINIPSVDNGRTPAFSQSSKDIIVTLINSDSDNKLKPSLHEVVAKILEQEYLFDSTVKSKPGAPPLLAAHNPIYENYWPQLFSVLITLDDKEIIAQAANLLEKHGAHPTSNLIRVASQLTGCQRPAVVKFIRAYCEEVVKTKPERDNMMPSIFSLATSLTRITPPRGVRYDSSPQKMAAMILEQLKE
jgi:HEAT repeat protein